MLFLHRSPQATIHLPALWQASGQEKSLGSLEPRYKNIPFLQNPSTGHPGMLVRKVTRNLRRRPDEVKEARFTREEFGINRAVKAGY